MRASVPVVAAALASDTSWAVTVAKDGTVRTWPAGLAASITPGAVHLEPGGPVAVAFSDPVLRVLWVADGMLRLYERGPRTRFRRDGTAAPAPIHAVALSPSGGLAVVACGDGTLRGLDVHTWEFGWTLATGAQQVQALAVASDGGPIVAAFTDGSISRYDLEAGTSVTVGVGPPTHSMTVTHDGETVVTASSDGVLTCWDPRAGTLPKTRALGQAVAVLAVDGTGDRVLVATDNGRLWLHDLTGGPSIEYIVPAEESPGEATAAAAPPPSRPPPVVDDDVRFTVYRPQALVPGRWASLLVFAHKTTRVEEPGQVPIDPIEQVEARARAYFGGAPPDPVGADAQDELTRGTRLQVVPDVPGIQCNPPYAEVDWLEPVHEVMFRLLADPELAGTVVRGAVRVWCGPFILGEVSIAMKVAADGLPSQAPALAESVRRYRKIFPSYSSHDDAIVEAFAEYARAVGDQYLQDVLALRAGEPWEPRLLELIEDADVFQLFWSRNSMHSPHCRDEWEHALALQRPSFVRPLYWEEPLPKDPAQELPPAALRALHFVKVPAAHAYTTGPPPTMAAPALLTPASSVSPAESEHYELVLQHMVEGNVLPFLGSQLTGHRTGPPEGPGPLSDVDELAAHLAERFDVKSMRRDMPAVAQYVCLTKGRPDLYRAVRHILTADREPGPVHRFLARLPRRLQELGAEPRYQLIVNTSFDTALEQAFIEAGEPYDLAVYMASGPDEGKFVHIPWDGPPQPISVPNAYGKFPISDCSELERTVIVKIHGTVDSSAGGYPWRENYVITEDHYIDYLSQGPIESFVPVQILDKLRRSRCLFLGFTMREWNLRVFLRRLWREKPYGARSWAIESEPDLLEKEFWAHSYVDLYAADPAQYVDRLAVLLAGCMEVSAEPRTLAPTGAVRDTTDPDSPYAGLTSYTQQDAPMFFGRDTERTVLISNLRAARLTLLYARGGTGKSSLLRAGVAARLMELAHRSHRRWGSAQDIPVVFSSWRHEPTARLIEEIQKAIIPFAPAAMPFRLPHEHLDQALEAASAVAGATLLVMLDQFEEYFLYWSREAPIGRFADELAACINRSDLRANFLISIREDAYSGLGDLFKSRIPNVYGNYLHLEHLSPQSARLAIEKPIAIFNELHEHEPPVQIEPALVEAVLEQLRPDPFAVGQSGMGVLSNGQDTERAGDGIAAPCVQLVMKRLWESERSSGSRTLRLTTLQGLGGAQTIVQSHVGPGPQRPG